MADLLPILRRITVRRSHRPPSLLHWKPVFRPGVTMSLNDRSAGSSGIGDGGITDLMVSGWNVAITTKAGIMVVTIALAGIFGLHLGLINHGSWGADEYNNIGAYADHGADYFWFRFWTWSPRPVSETLLWLYASVVVATDRPFIVPALIIFWFALIAAVQPAVFSVRRDVIMLRALSAMAILAVIVLGRHVGFVLYWPFGAAPYAPVIAAALFLLFYLSSDCTKGKSGSIVIMLAMLVALWSSEAGALFALIYCVAAVLTLLRRGKASEPTRKYLIYW